MHSKTRCSKLAASTSIVAYRQLGEHEIIPSTLSSFSTTRPTSSVLYPSGRGPAYSGPYAEAFL